MTVILNPFQRPPVPPSGPGPVVNPSNDTPSGGGGFGDLLRGLVYPCSGDPGFLEAASLEKPDTSSQPVAAAIFDQNGLFEGAVETGEAGVGPAVTNADSVRTSPTAPGLAPAATAAPPRLAHSIVPAPVSKPTPGLPRSLVGAMAPGWQGSIEPRAGLVAAGADAGAVMPGAPDEPAILPTFSAEEPAPFTRTATAPMRTLAATRPASIVPNTEQLFAESAGEPSTSQSISLRARPGSLLSRLFSQSAASMNAQVSVQAVEHGLSVVARLDQLGREEQSRLRDRIAATLSRHGFIGRGIILNGDGIVAGTLPAGDI